MLSMPSGHYLLNAQIHHDYPVKLTNFLLAFPGVAVMVNIGGCAGALVYVLYLAFLLSFLLA